MAKIVLKCDYEVYENEIEELLEALDDFISEYKGGYYGNFYIYYNNKE